MTTLDCHSLEDWTPNAPAEAWRAVEIVERYASDNQSRLAVRILEGPEKGRIVHGISPLNLRSVRGNQ